MQLRCTSVQHSSCAMRCMAAGRGPAGAPSAVRSLRSPSRLFLRRRPHTRPARSRSLRSLRKNVCGSLLPLPGSPLGRRSAVAFSPLRVLPCRCACACVPRPLRAARPGPAIAAPALPSPGRSAAPRLPRSARVRRCAAPWALAAAPALCSPSLRCGLPVWSPLLRSWSLLRFGSARRGPPSSPPSGLRARGLLARGGAALWAAFSRCAPGSFLCSGAAPPALFLRRVGFSPAPLPSPPPPLGAPGKRQACSRGLRPPCRCAARLPRGSRHAVRFPIVAAAGKGQAGLFQPLPLPLRYFWRKALTMANICATMIRPGLFGRFGAPPVRVSVNG